MDETTKTENNTDTQKIKWGHFLSQPRVIAIFFVLFFLLVLLWNETYRPHTFFTGIKEVEIVSGLGSRQIADVLKQEGIIRSKWIFELYITMRGEASSLKPGHYIFFENAVIPQIARDLVEGSVAERVVVIPEGWNKKQIALALAREGIVSENSFLRIVDAPTEHLKNYFLESTKITLANLEGFLFPDTYRFFKNSDPEDIAEKMLENFNKKMTDEMKAQMTRRKILLSDAVIMASLIEKEVVSDEDRAIVSGILWKRLEIGMPLQVDATIIYALLERGANVRDSKLSLNDLKIDSLYNTYTHKGLPPGPIASPGVSALRSAIFPKSSPYFYYLSTPDGRTIFSRTLEEHADAKARFLR